MPEFRAVFFADSKPASILILYRVKNCKSLCGDITMELSPLSKFTAAAIDAPLIPVKLTFCEADVLLTGTENLILTAGFRDTFLKGKIAMPFMEVDT